jgi:hypothetical protein
MDDITLNIKIGELTSIIGKLTFSLEVKPNLQGELHIYAYDPTDLRKSGTFLRLDANGYVQLKKIMDKIDVTINKLEISNQMKGMSGDNKPSKF